MEAQLRHTFHQRMSCHLARATDDLLGRRVEMFDHVAERLLTYLDDDVLVLRHARSCIDPQGQLDAPADFLGADRLPLAVDMTPPRPAEFDSTVVRAVVDHYRTAEQLGYRPAKWVGHSSAAVGCNGEATT